MGKVFEAVHRGTGRHVALKLILSEQLGARQDIVQRFQREARAAGAIDTRHIVKVVDTGVDSVGQRPYLVLDLLKGEDCSDLLKRVGPLKVSVALRIVAQACIGLAKAHDAGVVHRDIKPANLFLDEQDEAEILVKICDFGIAKVKMEEATLGDKGLTRTGSLVGSPLFMAPEQARGLSDIDGRADLWSLGVVLYQLLCGRTPFHHIEALGELIISICSEAAPPVQEFAPWVPPEVARLVHVALQLDKHKRFQTATEMLAALREVAQGDTRLRKDDLVGISQDERDVRAERIDPGTVDVAKLASPVAQREANARHAGSVTNAALTRTDPAKTSASDDASLSQGREAPKKRRSGLRALVAVVAVCAIAAGVFVASRSGRPTASQATTAPSAVPSGPSSHRFTSDQPVVITGDAFSGNFAFRSAEFLDAAARAGVPVRFQLEPDADKRTAALADGSVQFALTSLDRFLASAMKGKIVALIDASHGADALLIDTKEFPGLTDMKKVHERIESERKSGRKVGLAFSSDSASEYLLTVLDSRFDSFALDEFAPRPVSDASDAFDALTGFGNGVAIAALWEPYVTRAKNAGYSVVLSSADVDGAVMDVLVASDTILGESPNVVATLVERYYRFIDARIAQPQSLAQQIAEDGKLSQDEGKALTDGLRFFSAVGAARWLNDGTMYKRIAQTGAILMLAGKLDAPPADGPALVVADYIAAASAETQKLIDTVKAENPLLAARLEGSDAAGAARKLDAEAVADAEVLGELGVAFFASGKPDLDDAAKRVLDDAARRAADFNPRTVAVALVGFSSDRSAGERLAQVAADYLNGKNLKMPLVPLSRGNNVGGRPRVQIELVRPK
jgi:serine/threonine-protein kinase